ncbi:hypothetical protein ACFX2J_031638 [Malus domestica]
MHVSVAKSRQCVMAVGRVPHPPLKGPNLVKEIAMGIAVAMVAAMPWKMYQWDLQKRTRTMYELLDKGEATVVAQE